MTNITLSIDDKVYKKMKRYSEIKWSEFVRKIIEGRVEQLEKLEIISEKSPILADQELLAEDWLSEEDNEAWKDL
ncbi:hypothetical protein J4422_02085 [Candidatus Pacearchaeota archaeon]|nr:hypothetical protein [Candidatus Pacearchaeota archaeon]